MYDLKDSRVEQPLSSYTQFTALQLVMNKNIYGDECECTYCLRHRSERHGMCRTCGAIPMVGIEQLMLPIQLLRFLAAVAKPTVAIPARRLN